MDAARLVAESEQVMRGAPRPEDVIEEAWQAGELVEAVSRLLSAGDAAAGSAGEETGAGRVVPPVGAAGAGPPRAARLTAVRDPSGTLRALRVLLGEINQALVVLTCAVEDEGAYWSCVEALDAVDEARERVRTLVREGAGDGGARGGESSCGV
ncbi:DUF6099 family protein [Streptomyces sp. NPDC004031]